MKRRALRNKDKNPIHGFAVSHDELRHIISHLIHRREALRDEHIGRLERDAEVLIRKVKQRKQEILLEELACFKDILALHKELLKGNDKPRD